MEWVEVCAHRPRSNRAPQCHLLGRPTSIPTPTPTPIATHTAAHPSHRRRLLPALSHAGVREPRHLPPAASRPPTASPACGLASWSKHRRPRATKSRTVGATTAPSGRHPVSMVGQGQCSSNATTSAKNASAVAWPTTSRTELALRHRWSPMVPHHTLNRAHETDGPHVMNMSSMRTSTPALVAPPPPPPPLPPILASEGGV